MIKKIVICLVLFGVVPTLWMMSDPKFQKKIKDEREAESVAKEQEAKKKKEDWEQGWSKWFEEAKKNNAKRAKEPNEAGWDDGFKMGFMGGKLTRSTTNISPFII